MKDLQHIAAFEDKAGINVLLFRDSLFAEYNFVNAML